MASCLDHLAAVLPQKELIERQGKVTGIQGLAIYSQGPVTAIGETCRIISRQQPDGILAEVIGLDGDRVTLMAYEDTAAIQVGSLVIAAQHHREVPVGESLIGRVVNAFCQPLDGKPLTLKEHYSLYRPRINPLDRPRIDEVLETGVKTIDSLLTLAKGQRTGIFAPSGVGKSTLLGMIARNIRADINVIALVGERGREVQDFIEKTLGNQGLSRSVVVVEPSDQSPLLRVRAAFTATTIAEYFRDQGFDVMLIMDSVTRVAMAQREIGLAVGEPPTLRGYTASTFSLLPKLLERCGTSVTGGSITAIYTILTETETTDDPISEQVRSIIDGHMILSRKIAHQGYYPAIDILKSISRLMPDVVDEKTLALAQKAIKALSLYETSRDMIEIGAYRSGTNAQLDWAIELEPKLATFFQQSINDNIRRETALKTLSDILKEDA